MSDRSRRITLKGIEQLFPEGGVERVVSNHGPVAVAYWDSKDHTGPPDGVIEVGNSHVFTGSGLLFVEPHVDPRQDTGASVWITEKETV